MCFAYQISFTCLKWHRQHKTKAKFGRKSKLKKPLHSHSLFVFLVLALFHIYFKSNEVFSIVVPPIYSHFQSTILFVFDITYLERVLSCIARTCMNGDKKLNLSKWLELKKKQTFFFFIQNISIQGAFDATDKKKKYISLLRNELLSRFEIFKQIDIVSND